MSERTEEELRKLYDDDLAKRRGRSWSTISDDIENYWLTMDDAWRNDFVEDELVADDNRFVNLILGIASHFDITEEEARQMYNWYSDSHSR